MQEKEKEAAKKKPAARGTPIPFAAESRDGDSLFPDSRFPIPANRESGFISDEAAEDATKKAAEDTQKKKAAEDAKQKHEQEVWPHN
jgi:hypothetical protein